MESYDILVVLLSITLLFSLLIWLFVGVVVLQIVRKVKEASTTAQHAVENVEEFTEQLKGAGKATAVGSTFAQILNVLRKGKK
jgi:hypothetical protein